MKSEVVGHPSVVSNDLVHSADQKLCKRQCFTISELSCKFPDISRILLYEIITAWLRYHKFYTRWVQKMITGMHKTQIMALALTFCQSDTTKMVINFSITSYEKQVMKPGFVNVETKEQSKQ
jgi:hypothetical protein